MALLEIDRKLLQRCLNRKPHAWEDFVDRFVGLVVHVIHHTARARSIRLGRQDEEDLAAEFFLAVIKDDFAVLRRFRGESSLATYLTVVARRVVIHELLKSNSAASRLTHFSPADRDVPDEEGDGVEQRISNREEVERLLRGLSGSEAEVVRMYHLEGRSYRDISVSAGIPENTIGPMLSRARAKMRQATVDSSL